MRSSTLAISMSVFLVVLLVGLGITTAQAGSGNVKWERIVGFTPRVAPGFFVPLGGGVFVPPAPTIVGNINSVTIPWVAKKGKAKVNLDTGRIRFKVEGLVLAGSPLLPPFPPGTCCAALIGTTGIVAMVKGTLVCNATDGGASVTVDTPAVPLSSEGDARFKGHVGDEPGFSVCASEPDDIAFLIRIAETSVPSPIVDRWNAHGAVREIKGSDSD